MLHKLSLDANTMPYLIGKYRTRCLQINFHLVSKYCQTTSIIEIWLSNSMFGP